MDTSNLTKWIDEIQGQIDRLKVKISTIKMSLSALDDVGIETPTTGQVISYCGTAEKWINSDLEMNLSGLEDVAINTPTNNQIIAYDETEEKWINTSLPASGSYSETLLFSTTTSLSGTRQTITLDESFAGYDALMFVCGFTYSQENFRSTDYISMSLVEAERGTSTIINVRNSTNSAMYFSTNTDDNTHMYNVYGVGTLHKIYGVNFS